MIHQPMFQNYLFEILNQFSFSLKQEIFDADQWATDAEYHTPMVRVVEVDFFIRILCISDTKEPKEQFWGESYDFIWRYGMKAWLSIHKGKTLMIYKKGKFQHIGMFGTFNSLAIKRIPANEWTCQILSALLLPVPVSSQPCALYWIE